MFSISRIFKFALNDFLRNKGISLSAVFVLTIITILATALFAFYGASNYLVLQIQNKIDIAAYFKEDVLEEDVLGIREHLLQNLPNIEISYVSKEDALKKFTENHKGNEIFSRALIEVGGNPFLPALNIKTSGTAEQYKEIADVLQSDNFVDFIDRIDFMQKKDIIEKVFLITKNINNYGLAIEIILAVVAILIVFNTIKLAIDTEKEEINTMRIVGANNWFVRGPFIFQGVIYGFLAFLICFFVSFLLAYFLGPKIGLILPGFNLFDYFLSNLLILILIQFVFSIGLGAGASFVAVRKYLKV